MTVFRAFLAPALGLGLSMTSVCGVDSDLVSFYVREFNNSDVELYTNSIPNSAAERFLAENIPVFSCPDKDIERIYYFRWWTFRKHLRHESGFWTVSEFLPQVFWSGKRNTIVCPAGHHFQEGRWLRNRKIMSDVARFWLRDPGVSNRWAYASWLFTGVCRYSEIAGCDDLPPSLLDDAVRYYEGWESGGPLCRRPERDGIRMGGDGKGGFLSIDHYEGTEYSLGGNGYKPLFSSAMWSEAKSISDIARSADRMELCGLYAEKAEKIRQGLFGRCWNDSIRFFTTSSMDGSCGSVRELHGYAPWYFGMPTENRLPDWNQLLDRNGFCSRYGLTFPERRADGFSIEKSGYECKWNGPSWPFATSIALTALSEYIHSYPESCEIMKLRDMFVTLLRQYACQHRMKREDGKVVPWIDENVDPDTGEWLSRRIIMNDSMIRNMFPKERGKDYNHSTFCDLVISGLVGFRADGHDGFVIDPIFPETWDYLHLKGIGYRDHVVDFSWDKDKGVIVVVDGRVVVRQKNRGRISVRLGGDSAARTGDLQKHQQIVCLRGDTLEARSLIDAVKRAENKDTPEACWARKRFKILSPEEMAGVDGCCVMSNGVRISAVNGNGFRSVTLDEPKSWASRCKWLDVTREYESICSRDGDDVDIEVLGDRLYEAIIHSFWGAPGDPRLKMADPYVLSWEGKFYIYGTDGSEGFCAYISDDLHKWKPVEGKARNGLVFSKGDGFGTGNFWAPEVHAYKGRFYLFYSADLCCCIAVADSPLGPFRNVGMKPLIARPGGQAIDNSFFVDDDGVPWMPYSDNERLAFVRLRPDLMSVVPGSTFFAFEGDKDAWQKETEEGPSVIRVGNKYVVLFSGDGCESQDYAVGAGIADKMSGPWTRIKDYRWLHRQGGLTGTGHGAPLLMPDGSWRYVFHAHETPSIMGCRRTYVVPLSFDDYIPKATGEIVSCVLESGTSAKNR